MVTQLSNSDPTLQQIYQQLISLSLCQSEFLSLCQPDFLSLVILSVPLNSAVAEKQCSGLSHSLICEQWVHVEKYCGTSWWI